MGKKIILTGFLAAALAGLAAGQDTSGSKSKGRAGLESVTVTATVEAIDSARRELTLKGQNGEVTVMEVSPEIKRFPEIKVGDVLTVKYTRELVLKVQKADSSAKLGTTEQSNIERKPGAKPSGVISRQVTETVAVDAIDLKAPSITVHTANGDSHSFRVEDVKNLEGVSPGDKIVVTYTEAVAMDIRAPSGK